MTRLLRGPGLDHLGRFYWPELLPQRLAAAKEAWSIAEDRSLALPVVDLLPYFLADLFCCRRCTRRCVA